MRILITGNMGYLGPILAKYLKSVCPNAELIGYDTGYFGHCLTGSTKFPEILYDTQYYGDIRDIQSHHLDGVDAIAHLAAISNDPMGNQFENVTDQINLHASVRLLNLAVSKNIKNFMFASSCSMYGQSAGEAKKESDLTNPLTAYAKSKIAVEGSASSLDLRNTVFTSLRFATACGMSDRLRLDLVLNDFVACALTSKEISILSDGTPWRPLIDVEDMARAIHWALIRPAENGGQYLAVNAGKNEGNYRVLDLAEAVAKRFAFTKITINKKAPPDNRSYRVDFSLFATLAPEFIPKVTLSESIENLYSGTSAMGLVDKNFRDSQLMRLNVLRNHLQFERLDQNLRWSWIKK